MGSSRDKTCVGPGGAAAIQQAAAAAAAAVKQSVVGTETAARTASSRSSSVRDRRVSTRPRPSSSSTEVIAMIELPYAGFQTRTEPQRCFQGQRSVWTAATPVPVVVAVRRGDSRRSGASTWPAVMPRGQRCS